MWFDSKEASAFLFARVVSVFLYSIVCEECQDIYSKVQYGKYGTLWYKGDHVIKFNVEEWFKESRMSKLSLKKDYMSNKTLKQFESDSMSSPRSAIEISSDESDTSKVDDILNCDVDSEDISILHEQSHDETLLKFTKSTDSVQTEEDEENSMFASTSGIKAKHSMFSWDQKNTNLNKNNKQTYSDSDSDDIYQNFQRHNNKQGKKLKKTDTTELPCKSEHTEDVCPEVAIQYEQMISGIKVKLPVKPYSCQIAIVNKLIQACKGKENCLLESPTGSGKTLALLCGVLAWHDQYSAQVREANAKLEEEAYGFSVDEDFSNSDDNCDKRCKDECDDVEGDESCFENAFKNKRKRLKIPKIYYGTRTHKQIEQVVRELKKTAYKHKKMTILSSREHTCIQKSNRNKTDLCNDLLDTQKHRGCPYYNDSNKKILTDFRAVESRGLGPVWDIEDLVAIGNNEGLCPYFAARNLMQHADIIFCPYNYIVDPNIRESMQLDLKEQVIILDEAHNIEDSCREVASVNFREDHLQATAIECESLAKRRPTDAFTYTTIKLYILKLHKFLKSITLDKVDYNRDNNLSSPYWTGAELMELFNMYNLGEFEYPNFLTACNAAMQDMVKAKEEGRKNSEKPIISPSSKVLIGHLVFALRMITSSEFMNDYRACVIETTVKDFKYVTDDTWLSTKTKENCARVLKLICMNSGVIFSPLAQAAHCIVLASGTLTPTGSFQSELNTAFPHVLNTAHVIPKEQVYATCVPKGPNGVSLKADYQNVNSWSFQDELGKVLLDICESVPHGVLCFFSSYNVMHTQMERWKKNSIWNRITSIKHVFIEPRFGSDLNSIMNNYREIIGDTSTGPKGKINGALFLAVFRGKVAEGIDFRDDEARCVVTVGIPYAVRKDPVIDMKYKYNDLNTGSLLKGSEWYSIQAFRALNQALGRCLRHINDWGAVLLVDERFLLPSNKEKLPKWIKTMWITQNKYDLRKQLRDFVSRQKARETTAQCSL
ncbi:Fanconi anemia group J protein homolog isoform X1 [Nomia melanderi]|uniref:Fanconi anemia group J protein homolog isoform X1 n=2 Tax=Nomia melanderi TaxID=2448451 RepID=UPI003FCE3922